MEYRVLVVDDSATIRRIVSLILGEAGYSVVTAPDGAEALDRVQRERFDLVLVDFVMPRLNGFQFAQAVRSLAALRDLPIVLMSARAEVIAERFVASTGAVGWLAKPFSPSDLFACVARAIGQRPGEVDSDDPPDATGTQGVPRSLLDTAEALDDLAEALLDEADSPRRRGWTEGAWSRAEPSSSVQPRPAPTPRGPFPDPREAEAPDELSRVSSLIARALGPAMRELLSFGAPVDEGSVSAALRPHLTPQFTRELAQALRPLERGAGAVSALDGMLGAVPLGEVFQLLALQSQTGLLVVERSGRQSPSTISVALRNGRIDLCTATGLGEEFLLGRYLVSLGCVSREQVERAAADASARRRLLGESLVRDGVVSAEDIERALVRQSSELVYEALRWSGGRFRFEVGGVLAPAQLARLGIASESLVMEGFRRMDEWRLIGEYLPSEGTVLARDDAAILRSSQRLDRNERAVLDAVDGARTVREVVRAVSMSSFDACKILYRLLRARVVVMVAA